MFFFTSSGWEATSKPATHALPPVGRLKPRKHAHGGGLACPVGSQETENLAPMDLEGDVVYGGKIAETLGQPFHFNHIVFVVFHPSRAASPGGQRMPAKLLSGCGQGYRRHVSRPSLMKAMRSHWRASSMMGVEAMMVIPCSFSRQSIPQNSLRDTGSTPGSGFVQEEDIRFMDKSTAKGEFLLHAAGQRSGAALAERFYLPVNVAHQIIILLDGGVENGGEEIEILLYRQVRIEGEASGHTPHPPADGFVVLHHIQAADRSRASVGKQQGGEDAEKRCLARTVRPDDAEKLTGSY